MAATLGTGLGVGAALLAAGVLVGAGAMEMDGRGENDDVAAVATVSPPLPAAMISAKGSRR